jgi:hypothetical protein
MKQHAVNAAATNMANPLISVKYINAVNSLSGQT